MSKFKTKTVSGVKVTSLGPLVPVALCIKCVLGTSFAVQTRYMGYLTEIACTYCAIFIAEVLQINTGIDILITSGARSAERVLLWFKGEISVCAAQPDPVTLLRSLYLWNGLTDSRAVFFVQQCWIFCFGSWSQRAK